MPSSQIITFGNATNKHINKNGSLMNEANHRFSFSLLNHEYFFFFDNKKKNHLQFVYALATFNKKIK